MTFTEILAWLLGGLAVLGGGGVVIVGLAGFFGNFFANRAIEKHKAGLNAELERVKAELNTELERLKADLTREVETHKLKLRKQEILFAKELAAAEEFFKVKDRINPKFDFPDKDWGDVKQEVVENFTDTENRLRKFRIQYGPVLSTKVMTLLDECISLAGTNQFAVHDSMFGSLKEAEKAAENVLQALETIEKRFVEELRS